MAKPIIVGTDFSPRAEKALGRAAWFARRLNRPLRVVHAFRDTAWANMRRLFAERDWEAGDPYETAQMRAREAAAVLEKDYGIAVEVEVMSATATQALCSTAEKCDAELLVVGVDGENWRGDAYVGGTAHKLLNEAPCPLLIVRHEPETSYERAIVGIDFSAASGRSLDFAAVTLAECRLHVVHALATLNDAQLKAAGADDQVVDTYHRIAAESATKMLEDVIAQHCGEAGQRTTMHVEAASPDDLIRAQARAVGSSLAILGKHGQHAAKPLAGSNLVNVLHHADCDVLVVP